MRSKSLLSGLVGVGLLRSLVLGTVVPAGADTGAMTGWEYAPAGNGCTGLPPQPQAGFEYASDQFVLTDPVSNITLEINIDANVAAPQGVAPGDCAHNSNPVVPSLTGVGITSVFANGSSTACSGVSGTYKRVNSTVTIS